MTCSREGCDIEFEPRGAGRSTKKFCSIGCRTFHRNHTAASRARRARYEESERGRAARRLARARYSKSEKRRAALARYFATEKGVSARFRAELKQRASIHIEQLEDFVS